MAQLGLRQLLRPALLRLPEPFRIPSLDRTSSTAQAAQPGQAIPEKQSKMLFNDLGLSAELLRAIEEQGYQEATPVQRQAIPLILEGRDVLAGAQTGTGKTAGFTLPLLQRLQAAGGAQRRPRALILTPTRELAAQVHQSVRDYGRHLPFKAIEIFGGVSIRPQISRLRGGIDIVIATPGRLLDHLQQRTIDLSAVDTLVLDEADRMLDMGFIRDIRRILAVLPKQRQNLLFSARFAASPQIFSTRRPKSRSHPETRLPTGSPRSFIRWTRRASANCCRIASVPPTGARYWFSPGPSTAPIALPSS